MTVALFVLGAALAIAASSSLVGLQMLQGLDEKHQRRVPSPVVQLMERIAWSARPLLALGIVLMIGALVIRRAG